MTITQLLVYILATWRVTSLLVDEDGPLDIFAKFRHFTGVRFDEHSEPYGGSLLGRIFACFWCCSVWVGLLFVLLYVTAPTAAFLVALPFAISAAAILIDEIVF